MTFKILQKKGKLLKGTLFSSFNMVQSNLSGRLGGVTLTYKNETFNGTSAH